MRDVIDERDGWRVLLVHDDEGCDPREWDNLGVMVAPHREYILGDREGASLTVIPPGLVDSVGYALRTRPLSVVVRWLRTFHGATVVLPLGLLDHSGLHMYAGGGPHWSDAAGWDSGTVGLIFDAPATREAIGTPVEEVERVLRAEVEEYDQYLRGDCWGIVVERRERWTRASDGATEDRWGEVESCWGFLGYEYAEREARAMLDYHVEGVTR